MVTNKVLRTIYAAKWLTNISDGRDDCNSSKCPVRSGRETENVRRDGLAVEIFNRRTVTLIDFFALYENG